MATAQTFRLPTHERHQAFDVGLLATFSCAVLFHSNLLPYLYLLFLIFLMCKLLKKIKKKKSITKMASSKKYLGCFVQDPTSDIQWQNVIEKCRFCDSNYKPYDQTGYPTGRIDHELQFHVKDVFASMIPYNNKQKRE